MKFKRIIFAVIMVIGLLCALSFTVSAAEETAEYVISIEKDTYIVTGEGGVVWKSESLSDAVALCSGGKVRFDSISSQGGIQLYTGSFIFSGDLSLADDFVVGEGVEVEFSSLTLTHRGESGIKVLGGCIRVLDSYIFSDYTAFTIDSSAMSGLMFKSGRVASGAAAVDIRRGYCVLLGGALESGAEVCVKNKDTLTFSGSASLSSAKYDVETYNPISLSYMGNEYRGYLDVKYVSSFTEGSMNPICYSATESQAERINLFDENGMREYLTYLADDERVGVKNTLAVYKPLLVRYESDGELIHIREYLYAELAEHPSLDAECGYTISGYYLDEGKSIPFEFGMPVYESMTVYINTELSCPKYILNSFSFEYDGQAHTVGFYELSHPLEDEGLYTYEWLNEGGETVSKGSLVKLTDVSDSGRYKCRFTLTVGNKTVVSETEYVDFTVYKREITPPAIPSVYYTGKSIKPEIEGGNLFSFDETEYLNAGVYTLTLVLKDSENYTWSTTDGEACEVTFEILKAVNSWIEEPFLESVYEGVEPSPLAKPLYGSVLFFFADSIDGEYTMRKPTLSGIYYFRAEVREDANYNGLRSEPQKFSILADKPVHIWLDTAPDRTEYFAFDSFDPSGLVLGVEYLSGRIGTVDSSEVSVTYQQASNLRYSDSGVIIEYCGLYTLAPVSVKKLSYTIDSLPDDLTLTYDGAYHTYEPDSFSVTGLDGIPLKLKVIGGGTNAGVYEIRVVFETDSRNYSLPSSKIITLNVLPKSVDVIWSELEFVYNGQMNKPRAEFISVFSERIPLSVIGGAIEAGEGYSATAVYDGGNYVLSGETVGYAILKADYDMSGVSWKGGEDYYDAETKRVEISGLPKGVGVLGYTNSAATDVGEYSATVTLSYDERNYNKPYVPPYNWRILKADYDSSTYSFLDSEFEYDGNIHYPILSGEMPRGKDNLLLGYEFSGGAKNVKDGSITVKITFLTDSKNYNTPEPIYRTVRILPRGEEIAWSDLLQSYDGDYKLPSATHPSFSLTLKGGGVNAGEYKVTAVSQDDNYYPINNEAVLTVRRAVNVFLSLPVIDDVFYGGSPSPGVKVLYGTPEYLYFTDDKMQNSVSMPKELGEYYLLVRVPGAENYEPLSSELIKFSVIPIVKTGIEITLSPRDYFAFERISTRDFTAYAVNNDGSHIPLSGSSVSISYSGTDSLRAGQNTVTFTHGEFSFEIKLNVKKAVLNLSSVVWHGLNTVYDGVAKYATVTGLPDGVSVLEYRGVGKVKAGEYSVCAVLEYDEDNYVMLEELVSTMVIKKKVIVPYVSCDTVYDGQAHFPSISGEGYYVKGNNKYTDAGEYTVELELSDPENYTFSGDGTLTFKILPRKIDVDIEDLYLFWLCDGSVEYSVNWENVLPGDVVRLECYIDGDKILAKTDNTNYLADYNNARVIRVNGFSPDHAQLILIGFIGVILILMLIYIILKRRDALLSFAMAYKNKHRIRPSECETGCAVAEAVVCPEGALDAKKAEELLTDSQARLLVKRTSRERIPGHRRAVVNIGDISRSFNEGDIVNIAALKEKGLIPSDAVFVKVLSYGYIDKPLKIYANRFSLSAVKMIVLAGGEVIKTVYTHGIRK